MNITKNFEEHEWEHRKLKPQNRVNIISAYESENIFSRPILTLLNLNVVTKTIIWIHKQGFALIHSSMSPHFKCLFDKIFLQLDTNLKIFRYKTENKNIQSFALYETIYIFTVDNNAFI